ncbi:hypothetical protein IJ674_00920 [bacterium]|nr:hypothetical protein [bacterium]
MSMSVSPVKAAMSAVSSVAPQPKIAKAVPLGESIMPRKEEGVNRAKNIIFTLIETFAEKSKAKPDAERTVVDYIIILADKLKNINPAKYAA